MSERRLYEEGCTVPEEAIDWFSGRLEVKENTHEQGMRFSVDRLRKVVVSKFYTNDFDVDIYGETGRLLNQNAQQQKSACIPDHQDRAALHKKYHQQREAFKAPSPSRSIPRSVISSELPSTAKYQALQAISNKVRCWIVSGLRGE
eukprot:39609-Prorocentrum_minimum.AAC.2